MDKEMTKPSQNQRQEKEKGANTIDKTIKKEANTVDNTMKTSQTIDNNENNN